MQAYRLEAVVPNNGELQLKQLPFLPGETIEIIILSMNKPANETNLFPLKNTVLKYEDPTEPIAENDWDVLQ
jgi:hypothetical protein